MAFSVTGSTKLSELPYLDIHTHNRRGQETSVNVGSLSQEELRLESTAGSTYATAGIHPWWLEDISDAEIEGLKTHITKLAQEGRLWAIGETGLDRLYPEFLEKQKELFKWHMDLAEKHSLPIIIHSVRAGSDFLEVMKAHVPKTPWIFHDFRGNEQLVTGLLKLHPECYFSFGLSLDNSPQVRDLLPFIPMENIFLETDNQKHLDIHDIYLRASERLQVDINFLKSQIWLNFKKLTPALH